MQIEDLIIIGAGPAGYTASIYAGRAGLHHIIFEGAYPGGQLIMTSEVENYPGYPNGVLGIDMMEDFKKQSLRFGAKILSQEVKKVNLKNFPLEVIDTVGKKYYAKSIIIATGASARWLELENEKNLRGKGVSSCATCDGFFYRNKMVGVIGGGDTAAEEALYLSKISSKVNLFVRGNKMRASKIMQDRLFKNDKIDIFFNTQVEKIIGIDSLECIEIKNSETKEKVTINITGLFIAIGHTPNTSFLESQLELDDLGYIKTEKSSTKTSIPGVFAAGDVQDSIYRQAVTASASGCMAALEAEKYLSSL